MQVVLSVKESAVTDVSSDQLVLVRYMWVNNSGPIAMHEPHKSDDISWKTPLVYEKVSSSKVESYLKGNAWADWWQ